MQKLRRHKNVALTRMSPKVMILRHELSPKRRIRIIIIIIIIIS